ncbi:tripartite motif-containing protein 44 [Genypterus blacodes]|uniref:tripartite motif-containing protein 44 n=1 Tax=Genypterus blacodes TaxID=154954 RepID=UPI003F765167
MNSEGEREDERTVQKHEELPQMDGLCDVCEPDEAQPATQVCHICSFAFCSIHAENHASRTHHLLTAYNHDSPGMNRDCGAAGGAEEGVNAAVDRAVDAGEPMMASAEGGKAEAGGSGDGVGGEAPSGAPVDGEVEAGVEGAEAGEEVDGEAGSKDSVTVARLRCTEHGQEGSLYCKPDEKIICVVCAVQGEHKEHEIITLYEAYVWQKSRQGHDLLGFTQQMGENVKTKWTNPATSTEELEDYVNGQFDELRRLVHLEEKRTLHLVDLKEAFLTASAAEKIAEISVQTERLQEEMANITHQLCLLEQAEGKGPAVVAAALREAGPSDRAQHNIEARPRLPEPRADHMDPHDFGDKESGPSMDHAP